jgi:anti-sigma factor RsiW
VRERCPDGAALLALAEGRMETGASELERHLSECEECRREFDIVVRLTRALVEAARVSRPRPGSCDEGYDAAAYLSGALDRSDRLRYEHHVATCPACLDELSALMSARRQDAALPGAAAVAAAFKRLREEPGRIRLRVSQRTLMFVDGWITAARGFAAGTGFESRTPALSGVRSDPVPLTLRWETDGGYSFDCEVTAAPGGSELVGRVLRLGLPAADVSVSLRGAGVPHGPESLDTDGRFGPWAMATGESRLVFEALHLPRGTMAVVLELLEPAERVPGE